MRTLSGLELLGTWWEIPRKPVVLSNCPIDLGVFRVDLYVEGLQDLSLSQELRSASPSPPVRRFSARLAIKSMGYENFSYLRVERLLRAPGCSLVFTEKNQAMTWPILVKTRL